MSEEDEKTRGAPLYVQTVNADAGRITVDREQSRPWVEVAQSARVLRDLLTAESETPKSIRTLPAEGEASIPMVPMQSGRQIWQLIEAAGFRYFRTVEGAATPKAAATADELLDAAAGWSEISDTVIEHGFSAVRRVHENLHELWDDVHHEKLVDYGRRVIRPMTGGYAPDMPLPTVHLVVLTAEELNNRSESDGSLLV